jgi:hypothetical protein
MAAKVWQFTVALRGTGGVGDPVISKWLGKKRRKHEKLK